MPQKTCDYCGERGALQFDDRCPHCGKPMREPNEVRGFIAGDPFYDGRRQRTAESLVKIMRGESKPAPMGRTRDENESYRRAMIDAGRGRLLR